MTIAPETPTTGHEVAVRFSPDGTPLAIRYMGRIWMVDPDIHTAHWFTRDAWWFTLRREPLAEHWQLESIS